MGEAVSPVSLESTWEEYALEDPVSDAAPVDQGFMMAVAALVGPRSRILTG